MGYGRIMVGSLTIAYSHEHKDRKIYENGEVLQLMATDKVQGVYFDDTEVRHMSTTTGYVVDLVCESEISGLVTKTIKTTGQT